MKAKLIVMCILVVAFTLSAPTGVAYGDYLELATTPQQLGSGQWEYVYDLYSEGDQVAEVFFPGVDETKADSDSLYQRWDCNAAGFGSFLSGFYASQGAYPSAAYDGANQWTLNNDNSYALTNSWHDPSDYVAYHPYDGDVLEDCDYVFYEANTDSGNHEYSGPGLLWGAPVTMLGCDSEGNECSEANPGLVATFRLVSDDGPGDIDYELYTGYYTNSEDLHKTGTIVGPVPEPASLMLLIGAALSGLLVTRRRRR